MTKKASTEGTETKPTKRTRRTKAQCFIATLADIDTPFVVIAKTHKKAMEAVLTLRLASPTDLIQSGAAGYKVIDTTAPKTEAAA